MFCQKKDTEYVAASEEQEHSNRSHICKDILLLLILVFVKHSAPTISSTVVTKLILNKMAKSILVL
jgi:hypothetical protein